MHFNVFFGSRRRNSAGGFYFKVIFSNKKSPDSLKGPGSYLKVSIYSGLSVKGHNESVSSGFEERPSALRIVRGGLIMPKASRLRHSSFSYDG
jgi:hypothetical protein